MKGRFHHSGCLVFSLTAALAACGKTSDRSLAYTGTGSAVGTRDSAGGNVDATRVHLRLHQLRPHVEEHQIAPPNLRAAFFGGIVMRI